jgi:hypothetical protein
MKIFCNFSIFFLQIQINIIIFAAFLIVINYKLIHDRLLFKGKAEGFRNLPQQNKRSLFYVAF